MKKYRFDGIAIVFFFSIVGIFYYPTILYKKLPVPSDALVGLYHPFRDLYKETNPRGVPFKNFLITDPVRQQIPWRKIVIDAWRSRVRPRLNPYTFTGVPLDANIQAAPYYPLNMLFFIFDFPVAWSILIMLQPMLAGLFLYGYVRYQRVSILASIVGVLSWAFGGFATAWLTWGTILHTALWLPLILLSIHKLMEKKNTRAFVFRWYICLGFASTMTLFGGHIQIALYIFIFCMIYSIWIHKRLHNLLSLRSILPVLGVVIFLSAIQWVPFLRFLYESGRVGAVESWKSVGWFLPWQHLIQFIAPDFFGNPATLNYWGVWNYGEFIGYIGVIPLLLALSAVGQSGIPRFFSTTVLVSLFFMMPHALSKLPYQLTVPIVSVLQPTRLMVLVNFSLSILAACGFDMFIKGDKKQLLKSTLYVGVMLALLLTTTFAARVFTSNAVLLQNLEVAKRNLVVPSVFFAGLLFWYFIFQRAKHRLVKRVGLGFFVGVIVLDLLRFGWKFTPFTPIEYFFPKTEIIRFLQQQSKPFRIMSLDDRILPSNVSAYYGIETIEGYDPIAPKLYEKFLSASERADADTSRPTGLNRIYTARNIDSPLLPYFNVRYVLSLTDVNRPFLREVMREGETRVYEYVLGLPRVYLAKSTIIAQETGKILSTLLESSSFGIGIHGRMVQFNDEVQSASESVEIVQYETNAIRIKVNVKGQRLLVVLNRYDSRWSARSDKYGLHELFPVNYLFMGIAVNSGIHDVILSYR